ncbi:hypothetical protein ABZP36_007130 [Zizania latifolia]
MAGEVLQWANATEESVRVVKESKGGTWAIEKVMRETFVVVKCAKQKVVADLVGNVFMRSCPHLSLAAHEPDFNFFVWYRIAPGSEISSRSSRIGCRSRE